MDTRSSSHGGDPGGAGFLDERLGLNAIREIARHKVVPVHRHTFWYYWGGMALFLFLIQLATGILLLLYYRPSSTEAYESVQFIVTKVRWGWLVRSLHSICANLLILVVLVHLGSVYFLRAYRRPREFVWITGLLLFFVFLTFGFSGYLLPWNELAFFATSVGTDIPGAIPGVGDFLVRLVRGGPEVTGATLTRFYGLHVAVLPLLTAILLAAHVYLVQRHGMSVPRGVREKGPPMPFVPNFLLRDLIGWFIALAVLVTIIVLAPSSPRGTLLVFDFLFDPKHLLELGSKADPFSSAGAGIKPEWYFLFMYQTLKMIPAEVLGLPGETLGVLALGAGTGLVFLVPFVDRRASGLPPNAFSRVAGSAIVVFGILSAVFGAWCMLALGRPLGVIGGIVTLGWIVVSVWWDRRRPPEEPSILFPSLGWLIVLFVVAMTIVGRVT